MNTRKFQSLLILLSLMLSQVVFSKGVLAPPATYVKNPNLVFYHNVMATSTQTMYVKNDVNVVCLAPTSIETLKKAVLNVKLNWGGDNLYTTIFPANPIYSANVVIKAYQGFTGNTLVNTYNVPLTINPSKPQAYVAIDYTGIYSSISRFDISVSITVSGTHNQVNNITTTIDAVEEMVYNAYGGGQPMVSINAVTPASPCTPPAALCNMVKFSWSTRCTPAPNYQLQVLRLFNLNNLNITTDNTIQTTIDWSEALTIETGNSLNSIDLTMAEGKGYYLWRVRPIGNTYAGGVANDRNWGSWSNTGSYVQGGTYTITAPNLATGLFFFDQFDDAKNWIYSRSFIEPDVLTKSQVTIGESISYANGLQMSNQNQTKVNAYDQVVVAQSVYDYAGRATLNTLPAGVKQDYLGYIPQYLKNNALATYSAADFDMDGNYKDPAGMDTTTWPVFGPGRYYSNNNSDETNIPTAHGYPFNRTIYSRDGLNRVKEQSGAGEQHRQKTTSSHTSKSSYSSVADMELIRIFGDEAPAENSVVKVISTDANNTKSVSYISKEGNTIATCLSSPSSGNLRPLTPIPVPFPISKNMVNYIPYGSDGYIAFTNFSFTEPTDVTLTYSISPKTYSDICANICATCDYHVEIKVLDLENPQVPLYSYTIDIAPNTNTLSASCGTPSTTTTFTNLTLPAGDYYVERTIVAKNPPVGNTTFATVLDQNIQALETNVNTSLNGDGLILNNGTGSPLVPNVTVSMSQINTYLNTVPINLEGLYAYLHVLPGETFKKILFGCDTIRIPVSHCDEHSCGSTDQDYFSFFNSKFPGANIIDYTTVLTQNSDVNLLINNMYNAGYTCSMLWTCWKNSVLSYPGVLSAYTSYTASLGSVPAFPKKPDLIELFLNCTGYKIQGISSQAYASGSVKGYVSDAFGYFNYPSQNTGCETLFINNVNQYLGTTTGSFGSASAFATYFNGLASSATMNELKTNFFLCVKNAQPAGASAPTPSATVLSNLQTNCNQFCESQTDAFVSSLINAYHSNGSYVQGDTYLLVPAASGGFGLGPVGISPSTPIPVGSTIIPKKEIYCMAVSMVKQCQLNCNPSSPTFSMNLASLYGGMYDIKIPAGGSSCPIGYTTVTPTTNDDSQMLLNYMNARLDSVRQNCPANGVYWDWSADVMAFDPAMLTSGCSNYNTIFVHPSIPSYFELSKAACPDLIYNLNKVPVGAFAMGTPKTIYSLSPTLAGFSASTTTVSTTIVAINGLSTSNAVVIDAAFVSNAISPPSVFVFDALYNQTQVNPTIYTPNTTIYEYQNASWSFSLSCLSLCRTSRCSKGFCMRLSTYTASIIPPDEIVTFIPITCEEQTMNDIKTSMAVQRGLIINHHTDLFKLNYEDQCLKKENISEVFTLSYYLNYHQYTLYYYDRAGNLVRTVSPEGVKTTSASRVTHPAHDFVTEYDYNSIKGLTRQLSPDGGESKVWYNNKGMIRASQNAKQLANINNLFSYTKYDNLGRIIESGEMPSFALSQLNTMTYPTTTGTQLIRSIYDTKATGITYLGNKPQRYLQNRISYVIADKDGNLATTNDKVATYYSYDPHGNVEWMIQEQPQLGKNYIGYEYDVISGSVLKVKYNEGLTDQFFHRYTYDIDKRLKKAETSKDQLFWESDARYDYYLHGPLKRTLIGQESVQGLDYTYTIHGWVKGINHASLLISDDAGKDGGTSNPYVARDIFGSVLTYYAGDFVSKSSSLNSSAVASSNPGNLLGADLFNGNISAWRTNIGYIQGTLKYEQQTGNKYYYDELNRLVESNFFYNQSNAWTATTQYKELLTYDRNGNITHLTRNGYTIASSDYMDDLSYNYYNPNQYGVAKTNQLHYVTEPTATAVITDDIESQSMGNYTYDQIGNLIKDVKEGITAINWNLSGKIESIVYGTGKQLKFVYDALGNRVKKEVWPTSTALVPSSVEYYVLDAQGNAMAIYNRTDTQVGSTSTYSASFNLAEQAIYGSERLGRRKDNLLLGITQYTPGTNQPNNPGPVLNRVNAFEFLNAVLVSSADPSQIFVRNISTSNLVSGSGNPIGASSQVTKIAGAASAGRNVAILHDEWNNRLLSAYTINYVASRVTKQLTKIVIRDTIPVINDSLITATSPTSQSAFVKRPDSEDEYYYITIGTDFKPYYHIINLNTAEVTSANLPLDTEDGYGETMALIDDRTGEGNSMLYLRKFNGATGSTSIKAFDILAAEIAPKALALDEFKSIDKTGNDGDLVLSTNTKKLAISNKTAASGYEIRIYDIATTHDALALSNVLSATEKITKMEYNHSDSYLYFVKDLGASARYLWNCNLSVIPASVTVPTGSVVSSSAFKSVLASATDPVTGDLRKGAINESMVFMSASSATDYKLYSVINTDVSPTLKLSATTLNGVLSLGFLPSLTHVVSFARPSQLAEKSRSFDKKEYEIKDHLGNVRVVVADFKVNTPAAVGDLEMKFNNGTTEGFTAYGTATVTNSSNRMKVAGVSGTGATRTITGLTVNTDYMVSYDLDMGNSTTARLTLANGSNPVTGNFDHSGRKTMIFKSSSTGTATFSFDIPTGISGSYILVDNIELKIINTGSALSSILISENYNAGGISSWLGTGMTVTNTGTNLSVSASGAANATYSVSVIPGTLYVIRFKIRATTIGDSNPLYMGVVNQDDPNVYDQAQFMTSVTSSTFVNYTFSFVPLSETVKFAIYTQSSSGSVAFDLDDFRIDQWTSDINNLYTAKTNSYHNYSAFGAPQAGRVYQGNNYRYGFNGMEEDDEVKSDGNSINFGARIYDSRLGRWLSLDGLAAAYPHQSPYGFVGDSPILYREVDGNYYDVSDLNERYHESVKDLYQKRILTRKNHLYRRFGKKSVALDITDAGKLIFQNETRAMGWIAAHPNAPKSSKEIARDILSTDKQLTIASKEDLNDFSTSRIIKVPAGKQVKIRYPSEPDGKEMGVYAEETAEGEYTITNVYNVWAEVDVENEKITVNESLLSEMGKYEQREFKRVVRKAEKLLKRYQKRTFTPEDKPTEDGYNFKVIKGKDEKVVGG